jgi:hypothetical protein
MGYDFKNASRQEFRFNIFAWPCALTLAKNFDWKPMGTVLRDFTVRVPDELDISNEEYIRKTVERWDGEYCANEWQLVLEQDALNLGRALKKAVEVIPNERILLDGVPASLTIDEFPASVVIGLDNGKNFNYHYMKITNRGKNLGYAIGCFSGLDNKNYLKEFIQFCMGGEFDIL